MKKILLLMSVMFITLCGALNAQEHEKSVGLVFDYSTGSSIGAKFQYDFAKTMRGEASLSYYLGSIGTTIGADVNGHYLFPMKYGVKLYPLAGLSLMYSHFSILGVSSSSTNFGLNAGGGAEYYFTEHFKANTEVKYRYLFGGVGSTTYGVGVSYIF